jgi:uncharacterized membrane protein YphA (DoxX/SURF4 family)
LTDAGIGLLVVLGILFIVTGLPKIAGVKYFAEAFEKFGYPQWLRVYAGWTEFVGGSLLIAGIWFPPPVPGGGRIIVPTILGATWTNYTQVGVVNGTVTLVLSALILLGVCLSIPPAAATLGVVLPG